MRVKPLRLRTVPGRIRLLAAVAVLALVGLFAATAVGAWQAREGLRTIGNGDGPTVVATTDLYLALSDMDAQVTNALLTGQQEGWLCEGDCDRAPARVLYEIRREDAQRAALQAAELAAGDSVRLATVQAVLDGLHQYNQQVLEAMELASRGGPLPPGAVARYRLATTLMTDDLLPKANNLTLAGGAAVAAAHQDRRAEAKAGQLDVAVTGLVAIVVLAALQIYLAAQFHRVVNPLLAVATVGVVALTVVSASLLSTETEYLRVAKTDGFDPVLALSRTQALGRTMNADRSRFLLDPGNADRYDRMYLDKAQTIFYLRGAHDLDGYYAGLGKALVSYRRYQDNDRRVRDLAEAGKRDEAAKAQVDPDSPYLPHPAFRDYDERIGAMKTSHQSVANRAVRNGERELRVWTWVLPAWVLALAGLVVVGVRFRLTEYR